MSRPKIRGPYKQGLVLIRHRLVAGITAHNLWKINQVHAASLRAAAVRQDQSGQDVQETTGTAIPMASTDHEPLRKAHGGCSTECA